MKIILTEHQYKKLTEDVGEKYAERAFGIKPEFSDFDDKYKKISIEKEKEEIIFQSDEVVIIKNPKSLNNIGPSVRGIIDKEGNLYVELRSKLIHKSIIAIVESKLNHKLRPVTDWQLKLPIDFITVQRNKETNIFELGESNYVMRPIEQRKNIKDKFSFWEQIPSREEAEPIFNEFLNKANAKNSKINFSNKIISSWDQ